MQRTGFLAGYFALRCEKDNDMKSEYEFPINSVELHSEYIRFPMK